MVTIKYGSSVTGIGDELSNESTNVYVYPNPTAGQFTIADGLINAPIKTITVRDLEGRTIFASDTNENIDISYAANGIYLLSIERIDQTKSTIKIIKE